MSTVKPIAQEEWNKYDWIELSGILDNLNGQIVCIRGVKYVSPPNDGYHYIEVTTLADSEQKWARAVEIIGE